MPQPSYHPLQEKIRISSAKCRFKISTTLKLPNPFIKPALLALLSILKVSVTMSKREGQGGHLNITVSATMSKRGTRGTS